jgi:hypothetical protein
LGNYQDLALVMLNIIIAEGLEQGEIPQRGSIFNEAMFAINLNIYL